MSRWVQIGFTYYNDPPPGAGNLRWGGFSFAELGTASRGGVLTGTGNLGKAMGLQGEEPMGSVWTLYYNGHAVEARKEDRGYGQGGDGTNSDPRYAVDLYDGSSHGLPDLRAALHAPGSGALWIMRGRWHAPEALPPGVAHLPPLVAPAAAVQVTASSDPPDHSAKTQHSGRRLGEAGTQFQGHARAMEHLARRNLKL